MNPKDIAIKLKEILLLAGESDHNFQSILIAFLSSNEEARKGMIKILDKLIDDLEAKEKENNQA